MPGFLLLAAIVAVPALVILAALALIGSSIALLAEENPLVGHAR